MERREAHVGRGLTEKEKAKGPHEWKEAANFQTLGSVEEKLIKDFVLFFT